MEEDKCIWKTDSGDDWWMTKYITQCGQELQIRDSDYDEDVFLYCPFCRKLIFSKE